MLKCVLDFKAQTIDLKIWRSDEKNKEILMKEKINFWGVLIMVAIVNKATGA